MSPHRSLKRDRYARQAASLVSAAAVGALLFSVRVATSTFREMPNDRALAGRIAGRAFTGAYWIAVVAAVIAVAVVLVTRSRRGSFDAWLAGSLLSMALLQLSWIAPAIAQHGVGWPGSFASLHAVGGVLHVGLSVVALVLAWRLLDVVEEPADELFAVPAFSTVKNLARMRTPRAHPACATVSGSGTPSCSSAGRSCGRARYAAGCRRS